MQKEKISGETRGITKQKAKPPTKRVQFKSVRIIDGEITTDT